jgi:hypothetical protein
MKNMAVDVSKEFKIDENQYGQMLQNIHEMDEELTAMSLEMGEYLYIIKHNKLYEFSGFNHWNDFLKDIGIPISEAETLIKVFITFPPKARFMVPFRRLKKMIKCFDEDLIEKAIALPYYEFIDEVNIKKGRRSRLECDHSEGIETYFKCKKCGSWHHQKEETKDPDKVTTNQESGPNMEQVCSS